MKPSTQSELFGMEKFFNEIINLYNKKKLPNKILLTGNKGLGKSTLAYHLINYILSNNEDHKYDTDNFKINENNKSFIFTVSDVPFLDFDSFKVRTLDKFFATKSKLSFPCLPVKVFAFLVFTNNPFIDFL